MYNDVCWQWSINRHWRYRRKEIRINYGKCLYNWVLSPSLITWELRNNKTVNSLRYIASATSHRWFYDVIWIIREYGYDILNFFAIHQQIHNAAYGLLHSIYLSRYLRYDGTCNDPILLSRNLFMANLSNAWWRPPQMQL